MMNQRKRSETIYWALVLGAALAGAAATWNSGFEASPPNSESLGLADDRIRELKTEIRKRGGVEHDWDALGNVTTDTGRHLMGSARIFLQSSAPPVDGTTSPNCLAEADNAGHRHCDAGRLWWDTDDNRLYTSIDAGSDGDADSWQVLKVDGADVATGTVDPARLNATATPTASKIPIADGSGKLADGWISLSSVTQHGVPVKICDVAATSAPSCNNLDAASYKSYTIRYQGSTSSGSSSTVLLRTDSNNGASYDSGSIDYRYSYLRADYSGATPLAAGSSGNSGIVLSLADSLGSQVDGEITLINRGSGSAFPVFTFKARGNDASYTGTGIRASAAAINAVRITTSANTNSIAMQVYGNP